MLGAASGYNYNCVRFVDNGKCVEGNTDGQIIPIVAPYLKYKNFKLLWQISAITATVEYKFK